MRLLHAKSIYTCVVLDDCSLLKYVYAQCVLTAQILVVAKSNTTDMWLILLVFLQAVLIALVAHIVLI